MLIQQHELVPSSEVMNKLSLYSEHMRKPYQLILGCLFQIYEQQLEQTVNQVKTGHTNELQILPMLMQFKQGLITDCALLIDEIWNNYKFYAL